MVGGVGSAPGPGTTVLGGPRKNMSVARRKRFIADVDWTDPLSCLPIGESLVQQIPGSTPFSALRLDPALQTELRPRLRGQACPYCGEALAKPKELTNVGLHTTTTFYSSVDVCDLCGFWRYAFGDTLTGVEWTVPFTRSFQPEAHTPALAELAARAHDSPERLNVLSPLNFELFVGTVLKEHMECDVKHVGGTHDGGIDLLVLDADPPLVVQVKRRRRRDSAEGVEVVKTMFATMFGGGHGRGMVVTSANRFTRGARAWARLPSLSHAGFEIDLVDINRLIDMTRPSERPAQPAWQTALSLMDPVEQPATGAVIAAENDDELAVETVDYRYVFVRPDRDTCTAIRRNATRADEPTSEAVSGFQFVTLLRNWPRSAVDAVVRFWAGPQQEDLVEFEP